MIEQNTNYAYYGRCNKYTDYHVDGKDLRNWKKGN